MLNRLIAVFALVTAAFAQPVLADAAPLSGAFPLLVTPYTAEARLDITTPVMRLDVQVWLRDLSMRHLLRRN